jgi:hypothetical protein
VRSGSFNIEVDAAGYSFLGFFMVESHPLSEPRTIVSDRRYYVSVSTTCFDASGTIVVRVGRTKVRVRKEVSGHADLCWCCNRPSRRSSVASIVRGKANIQRALSMTRNNIADGTISKRRAARADPQSIVGLVS